LTASQKVHLPFDMLTALSKAEGRRYSSSFVIPTYDKYASFLKIRVPPWAGFRFAQLASGAFCCAVRLVPFCESILIERKQNEQKTSNIFMKGS
jgi:hypothetical protein